MEPCEKFTSVSFFFFESKMISSYFIVFWTFSAISCILRLDPNLKQCATCVTCGNSVLESVWRGTCMWINGKILPGFYFTKSQMLLDTWSYNWNTGVHSFTRINCEMGSVNEAEWTWHGEIVNDIDVTRFIALAGH